MKKDILNQEPERHESYGMLSISRVTASPSQPLFGSSIRHGNFISLKILKGRKYRDFQSDRYMGDGGIVEVCLSPTQFAEAITCLNVGDGVPCTIRRVIGDELRREPCPEVNFRKQANEELKEEISELGERVEELSKVANDILTAKGTIKASEKKTLYDSIRSLVQEVRSNIPFVHDCFNRSVNKTVTEAKGEIDATLQMMRERLGDKVLSGEIEIPLLDDVNEINTKEEKDDA